MGSTWWQGSCVGRGVKYHKKRMGLGGLPLSTEPAGERVGGDCSGDDEDKRRFGRAWSQEGQRRKRWSRMKECLDDGHIKVMHWRRLCLWSTDAQPIF